MAHESGAVGRIIIDGGNRGTQGKNLPLPGMELGSLWSEVKDRHTLT